MPYGLGERATRSGFVPQDKEDAMNDVREVLYDPAQKSVAEGRELAMACFERIVRDIHTTVVATTDDDGLPHTSVIDMMDYDEGGLYFLTNVGKPFYERLTRHGYLSLSATDGKPTMECTAVTLAGQVREVGAGKLAELMEKNPYMYELYPTEERRATLRAFQISRGSGNLYEMAVKPPKQTFFEF